MKTIWHWWKDGKRIGRRRALQPGMASMRILSVREDHKGRMLIDAEILTRPPR